MDIDTSDAALEAALVASAGLGREDEYGFDAWLRSNDVVPGRFPSIPTCEAWVLYRAWGLTQGVKPLPPFEFARAMLGRFEKRASRVKRADGIGYRSIGCYCVGRRARARLRAQALANPPTPADLALFSFSALRIARVPSLAPTLGPMHTPPKDL